MAIPNITPPTGAWKTVKDLIADTVGPMAVLGAAASTFVKASAGAALNAQKMQQALAASEGANKILRQFETLTGSAEAARKQVEMLAKVASGGAFSFESLAEASKNLQVLTNGALNTEQALKKIQDVAAATGTPVDQVAAAVADLYSSLKSGNGVEQAANQLKQMGVISDQTSERLKGLNQAGAGFSATWQVVEADLKKSSGAASELAGTISGLQQQLASIQQASDTKIGKMFEEGEKAGLRAAIGFQKFTAAVQEANAGPWAAFNEAVNSAKESVGNFAGRAADVGAVKAAFELLSSAAIGLLAGAFVPLLTLIGPLTIGLYKLAAGTKAVQVAMSGVKGWGAMWSGLTVGISAAAGALALFGSKIYEASQSMRQMRAESAKFKEDSRESLSKFTGIAFGSSLTPEENDATAKGIEEEIQRQKSAKEAARKKLENANKNIEGSGEGAAIGGKFNPLNIITAVQGAANAQTAQSDIQTADNNIQSLIALQDQLNQKAMDDGVMGADKARLDLARQRLDLEKQIAEAAKKRLAASFSPANAQAFAEQELQKATEERKFAESQVDGNYQDARLNESASTRFASEKASRDQYNADYLAAVKANDEIRKNLGIEDGDLDPKSARYDRSRKLLEEQGGAYAANEKIIAAGPMGSGRMVGALREMGVGAKTEVGRLQADMDRRQILIQEERDAIAASSMAASMPGASGEAARKVAKERLDSVNTQIEGLRDSSGNVVGREGLKGKAIDELGTNLNTAKSKADLLSKIQAEEDAKVKKQGTAEAAAADKAAEAAGKRKLNIQKQLAALQGVEGGDGRAAEVELGPEIQQLQEKLKAVQELEAAEKAYNEALNSGDRKKIDAAQANVNAKRVTALGAGAQAGDTSASIEQEKQGVTQILEIRKQQAAVEQAAAQARRDEIMQELRLRQQISQLAFSNATGTTGKKGGQSEIDLRIADVQRTRSRAEEAQALVAERDALRESGGNTDELDKRIAELGFDKNTNAQDIQSTIKKSDLDEDALRTQQIGENRQIERNARIQSLSMQEKFAPTTEARERLKKEREGLEDQATVEAKTAQYSQTMDPELAKELATQETQLDRLKTRDEEAGTPRVDSLTAVGGGATGFMGASPADIQKEIKAKTVELADTLKKVNEALREQTALGKGIQTKLDETD